MPHTHMAICQNDIHLKQPRPSIRTSLSFQLASVQSIWSCLPYLPFLPSPRWPIKPRRFLSDPNPIIGYACQWLTDWLIDWLPFSKLDWCDLGVMPTQNLLRLLLLLMLMMRIVLATVCCRFGSWGLVIKLSYCSDFEHFGQDFEVEQK